MDYMRLLLQPHEEVLGLEVTMQEILRVHMLYFMQLLYEGGTIWSAIISTVFRLNFLPHIKKRSYRVGPNRSITI